MIERLYIGKDNSYFSNIREDIVGLIPYATSNVLEIGCGAGYTLAHLKHIGKAGFTVGMDLVDLGQDKILDKFICGDAEQEIDRLPFDEGFFDVVICADVLEHLIDPWVFVKKLHRYIKNGGLLIASIPNIREIKILYQLVVKGDFRYTDTGILDKSHLRFFCKRNAAALFEQAGFSLERVVFNLGFKRWLVNAISFHLFSDFLVRQYLFLLRKGNT